MITNALSEGGVESLLLDLCSVLVQKYAYDVKILVLNRKAIGLKNKFEKLGIEVIVGKYRHVYNPLNIFIIKKYFCNVDLVHVNLYPCQFFVALVKCLYHSLKAIPLVTTEHSTFNHRRKYAMFRLLDNFMYSRYDKIVCISKQTELKLRQWLLNKNMKNICTINNGVNIEKFVTAKNSLGKYVNILNGADYIVMVGRLEHPKDPMTIIQAMQYLPISIHLLLVGTGSYLNRCKILAEKYRVYDRVHFLGNSQNVAEILKGCRLGILSTEWEGFGLVAVEYMAAGIPVIASDVDGLREVVGEKSLLFTARDAKGLSDKILALLSDDVSYQIACNYCMNRSKDFSVEKMVANYVSVYVSMFSNQSKNGY